MALFGNKKKDEPVAPVKTETTIPASSNARGLAHVILRPRVTEKATMHGSSGVYTFNVAAGTNKREVMEAVRALYKVNPRKVSIITIPTKVKRSPRTGKATVKGGGKKAYVYLKEGDSLQIN